MVLVVEDVHWADQATLDPLAFVLRRLDQLLVLLVLTLRRGLDPTHPLWPVLGRLASPVVAHVDLAPLSPAAVAELASGSDPRGPWRRTGDEHRHR